MKSQTLLVLAVLLLFSSGHAAAWDGWLAACQSDNDGDGKGVGSLNYQPSTYACPQGTVFVGTCFSSSYGNGTCPVSQPADDNCPNTANTDQTDTDGDGPGDACDTDDDNDGLADGSDNCPVNANTDQLDTDHDFIGDACDPVADPDTDEDGVPDKLDNCPLISNADQAMADADGTGDVCDDDDDGDGVADASDAFPQDATATQDGDGDGYPDVVTPLVDGFESGALNRLPWKISGEQNWGVKTGWAYEGAYAARCYFSAEVTQSCVLELRAVTGATLSFRYFYLQQSGNATSAKFYVDGVDAGYPLAPNAWTLYSKAVTPGMHVLRWVFTRTPGTTYPQSADGLWLDNVSLGSALTVDNCPSNANPDQLDDDSDGQGNACDMDGDNDAVPDASDNCPLVANSNQLDTDGDAQGNVCDVDDDNDGVIDGADNCPLASNPDQLDDDGDGQGNACDMDGDNDGIPGASDNCPLIANSNQLDTDGDAQGNACDADDDNDGVIDGVDNCPLVSNPDQADGDGDGSGDLCDPLPLDMDNDGVPNAADAFPRDAGGAVDTDGDGQPDTLLYARRDQFETGNLTQLPWSTGGGGWVVQSASKKEGLYAARSATTASTLQFPYTMANAGSIRFYIGANSPNKARFYIDDIEQLNHSFVFTGAWVWTEKTVAVPAGVHVFKWTFDGCSSCSYYAALDDVRLIDTPLTEDLDDDNDGVPDTSDRFPLDATESQDTDNDGVGNNEDTDDDNDAVPDAGDNCPLNSNANQLDTDADALGNVCDADDDNDGVNDAQDAFPLDPAESADFDGDGLGDNRDNCPSIANSNQLDTDADTLGNVCDGDDDNDGYSDVAEVTLGSDPLEAGSIPVTTIISFETGIPAGFQRI
jgi:hypothetical protein